MNAASLLFYLAPKIPARLKALTYHFEDDLFCRIIRRQLAASPGPRKTPAGLAAGEASSLLPGVNLIGYARGVSGLGENLRMSVNALEGGPVEFSVVNFEASLRATQIDPSLNGHQYHHNPFRVNLFHMEPYYMPLVWQVLGPEFFRGRYNIASWMWELDSCPKAWLPVLDLVDEIWTPTRFVQEVFAKETSKPVVCIPLAVSAEVEPGYCRRDFDLPEDRYLFLFCFDWHSSTERKNPIACIRAFRRAFPKRSEPAGLVVKSMNGDPGDARWRSLMHAMGDDHRIILINETYTRDRILGLMSVCDCFVSLHRAEGFGRGPAEAMLLEKPVIASDYSGNTDFTLPAHSCPVDCRLIPVRPGEFRFAKGKHWAEPDVDHAARHMRRLAADPEYGRRLGRAARAYMLENYSPLAVGKCYHKRLAELQMV